MNDSDTNIEQLKKMVQKHCEDRDWDSYHNPKDLAVSMMIEVAEVLEHFRFESDANSIRIIKTPSKKKEIGEELSDVLYHLFRIAQLYGIDLSSSFNKKMMQNRKKYPIKKSKGSNKKYDRL